MMSSLQKRPASPSHCSLYVPAAKRPRLAFSDKPFSEFGARKRKYSGDFCESCLNNQRAEEAIHIQDILHNACSRATESTVHSGLGTTRCRNFQKDSAGNGHLVDIGETNPELNIESRSRKKQRICTPDEMQIIYKGLSQPKSAVGDNVDVDPEFNSFNFWKPVLPNIESQLCSILEDAMDSEPSPGTKEEENPEFNSFNYWRLPLQDIDLDLDIDDL